MYKYIHVLYYHAISIAIYQIYKYYICNINDSVDWLTQVK